MKKSVRNRALESIHQSIVFWGLKDRLWQQTDLHMFFPLMSVTYTSADAIVALEITLTQR